MASGLRTYCRRCRKEVPAAACDLSGLCVVCLSSDAVQDEKAEYQRLWAKRARYIQAGISVKPVEKQLAKVAERLGDKVHARIGNPQQAIAILNAHLEEARNRVERGDPHPRILIPRLGDMLAKNNVSAGAGLLHA